MSDGPPQINVAILAVPEVTAFATYAMYDLFAGAGRDWAFITTGVAAPSRMRPYIVAAQPGRSLLGERHQHQARLHAR